MVGGGSANGTWSHGYRVVILYVVMCVCCCGLVLVGAATAATAAAFGQYRRGTIAVGPLRIERRVYKLRV